MILFVNACVRGESRTRCLAEALLDRLGGEMEEVRLHEIDFPVVDEAFLEERDRLIAGADRIFDMGRAVVKITSDA